MHSHLALTYNVMPPTHAVGRTVRESVGFEALMKSLVVKRSIIIDGHRTSVSIEEPFWIDLKKIARTQQVTLSELVTKIDHTREQGNLSSAIRLFVLHHVRCGDKRIDRARAHPSAGG